MSPTAQPDRWPLELRLVVGCVRAALGARGAAPEAPGAPGGEPAARGQPDWERFLFWTERHRVTPLVYAGLGGLAPVRIPEPVRAELRDRARRNALRMLRLGAELVQVVAALEKAGIPALAIKGPTLALQAHGDIALRQVKDLDLLVAARDLERAIDLVRARGYRPVDARYDRLSPRLWEIHRGEYHEVGLVHRQRAVVVELHWNLLGRLWPLTLDELAGRSARVRLAGRDVAVLGPVDLLLHLALHGSAHAWRRLSWLAELARLAPRTPDDTWRAVAEAAAAGRVERPLAQGLALAGRLFATPMPEPLRPRLESDRAVRSLTARALSSLADEADEIRPGLSNVGFHLFYLARLRRSAGYRLRVLHALARPPGDVLDVALPDRLAWLYYPLRPLLWLGRRLRARSPG